MQVMTGRYWPADSGAHRMDPRVKIALVAMWSLAVLLTRRAWGFAMLTVLVMAVLRASSIPARLLHSAGLPLYPFALLTVALTSLSVPGAAWARLGPMALTREGTWLGLVYAGRMFLLVWGAAWLTWTTSPVNLASGLSSALRPLRRLRVPVEEVALVVMLAIRFIPSLFDEALRVGLSLRARGLRTDRGPLRRRLAVVSAMVVPLFSGAVRRADAQALALEARGWRGREIGFTRRVPFSQWVLVAATFILLSASLWLGR